MKVAIGADHAGFELKESVKTFLSGKEIDLDDFGTNDTASTDYPDYAQQVASVVAAGKADFGILVCSTGIGMSMAANKFCDVRAALCSSSHMAHMARMHNNANILVLGQKETTPEESEEIINEWLSTDFESGGRHTRRIAKISTCSDQCCIPGDLASTDPAIKKAINQEVARQQNAVNLIASENSVSKSVQEAQGSVMTNKYAEGYPGKRWYNGCDYVDVAEQLAIDRAKELFGAEHANVQPHCGSSANMAVYFSVLEPGDTVMAMSLAHGGHLTHGHNINFSGRLYNFVPYGVKESDGLIDYDEVERIALESKPKMIVVGASAYSRILDFERFRAIADKVGAYLMVDMAHIAGLVAAGVHPNPVPCSHFVTTTTHKTLRGPRGGMVLCKKEFAAEVDKQVFPGLQGGPLMHVIAAKAVCFLEAQQPEFKVYGAQVVKSAQAMAKVFSDEGVNIVSGGTDNHLMLLDLSSMDITGKDAAQALDGAGIIVNKNSVPFDKQSPFVTSGIRIGTPTITSRGMKDEDASAIASMIVDVLRNISDEDVILATRSKINALAARFIEE